MQVDFDVIIIGAGLAGGCLALALAESDLRIAVVETTTREQRFAAEAGDRALALASGTVDKLKALRVWDGLVEQATPIKQIHISDQGHFGKTRLSAEQERVDSLGYVIAARIIEDRVAALMEESAGITQFCPARVAGISSGPDEASISIKQGNRSEILNARLIVGADGGQSSVRKLLDIGQQVSDYAQTAIVTTVKSSKHHAFTAYERFTSSGPLALLPTTEGQSSVVWTRTTEQADALMMENDAEFLKQLQACFGYRLGELKLSAPRRAFPLKLIRAEQMHVGRVVIIGNAAHQLHPVAGQGFNLGIRDVIELAASLTEQQQSGGDTGDAIFLQNYVRSRLKDHQKVIGFTDGVVKIFSNQWLILSAARSAGLAVLDRIPFAKSYLARQAMGLER